MSKNTHCLCSCMCMYWACVRNLYSYVRILTPMYGAMLIHTRPCSSVHTNACSNMCTYVRTMRTHAQTCVRMLALRNPNFYCFNSISFISLSNGNSHVLFHLFAGLSSFLGRGSTSHVFSWYRALADDTKALVCTADFKPILHLLPKSHASGILVQSLAERWWDTTQTFHIAERGMTVTSHNFHWMTGLQCDGSIINFEGELGIQLGIELLGWRHTKETICFFDLKTDHKPLSWERAEDYTKMVKVFLLYILGSYLFTNEGKIVSLRWLALFRDFENAQGAN